MPDRQTSSKHMLIKYCFVQAIRDPTILWQHLPVVVEWKWM